MDLRKRVEDIIESQSASDSLLEYDWLDWIQLACDLEDEFGIQISDDELERCKTVDEIADYITTEIGVVTS